MLGSFEPSSYNVTTKVTTAGLINSINININNDLNDKYGPGHWYQTQTLPLQRGGVFCLVLVVRESGTPVRLIAHAIWTRSNAKALAQQVVTIPKIVTITDCARNLDAERSK